MMDGMDRMDGGKVKTNDGVRTAHPQTGRLSEIKELPNPSEIAANAALVLIGVASSLLDPQLAALATSFAEQGGFTERLYRIRNDRKRQEPS